MSNECSRCGDWFDGEYHRTACVTNQQTDVLGRIADLLEAATKPMAVLVSSPEQIEEAAKELAEAKKAYAESFLRYRLKVPTDKQAEYRAEIDCGERLILAQARYQIAERG